MWLEHFALAVPEGRCPSAASSHALTSLPAGTVMLRKRAPPASMQPDSSTRLDGGSVTSEVLLETGTTPPVLVQVVGSSQRFRSAAHCGHPPAPCALQDVRSVPTQLDGLYEVSGAGYVAGSTQPATPATLPVQRYCAHATCASAAAATSASQRV